MSTGSPPDAPLCLPPLPPDRALGVRLPPGTCDCHIHVFGAPEAYPLVAVRNYTPQRADLTAYGALMAQTGIDRAVLVQPSVYGTDNRALLDALALDPHRFRAVAVVVPDTPQVELERLHAAGVRGVRVNRRNPGGLTLADMASLAARLVPLGWHIQLQIDIQTVEDLPGIVAASPVPIVIDHLGFVRPDGGVAAPAFQSLLRVLDRGDTWLKLSGPYRLGAGGAPFDLLLPFIRALVAARPDRLLWGSDWPHSELWDAMPDSIALAELAQRWFDTPDVLHQILVDNPQHLYWTDGAPIAR